MQTNWLAYLMAAAADGFWWRKFDSANGSNGGQRADNDDDKLQIAN